MANRFTQDIAVSRFDPLSLDEILAPALAKQKQHDALMQQAQDTSVLTSPSLEIDKAMVDDMLGSFKQRSADLAEKMNTEGYNRSIKNEFLRLQADVNKAYSSTGKIGMAQNALTKYQANMKAINDNAKLSSVQKRLGMKQALDNYKGVVAGGTWQDYQGADYKDLNKMALDIGSKMKPEEIAGALGMTYKDGVYSDGTYSYKELSPQRIAEAVMQTMSQDDGVGAYLQDMYQIGAISDPKAYLQNVAINAGNVLQQSSRAHTYKAMPEWYHKRVLDNKNNFLDNSAGWSSTAMQTRLDDSVESTQIETEGVGWKDDGNLMTPEEMKAFQNSGFFSQRRNWFDNPGTILSGITDTHVQEVADLRERINGFRQRNNIPSTTSDRQIANILNSAGQTASMMYSEVYKTQNNEHTLNTFKENLFGGDKEGVLGEAISRSVRVDGLGKGVLDFAAAAEELGFDSPQEFNDYLKKGSVQGVAPSDPDFPMGIVVQFPDEDGNPLTITIENTSQTKQWNDLPRMVKNLQEGKDFDVAEDIGTNGDTIYNYYVLEGSPEKDDNGRLTGQLKLSPVLYVSDRKFENREEFEANKHLITEKMTARELAQEAITGYSSMLDSVTQKKP